MSSGDKKPDPDSWREKDRATRAWSVLLFGLVGATATTFVFPSLPCYLLLQFLALFDLVHVANSILIFVVTWQAGQLRRTADWVYTQV
ncbi:hypothetical protein BHE74_00003645 [Ensete ventricosum]|nr:hypothetical protein GW17_00024599 [Ensete ventricosum]RWW87525.1 hypothetical protein BHE74_00003645 [Ensete ventricosum]